MNRYQRKVKIDKESTAVFDKARATNNDQQWAKLAAMKDALHLFTRVVLADLPSDANILCVGVGTGAELFDLADHNPRWRFTAVDPSAPMLELCRQKAEEQGKASRCSFHEGYLDTYSQSRDFNAATCFLVSHFLTKRAERQALFAEIRSRLLPNGILVNADISGDMAEPNFKSLLSVWLRMMLYAGLSADEIEKMRTSLGVDVAVLPPKEIEEMIKASGFNDPTLMFQFLLIHAWYSRLGA